MNRNFTGCRVEIGSLTTTLKAQKALAVAAIPSTVVKIEKNESSFGARGCSYGLSFSCAQGENLKRVLEYEGIRVKRWM